MAITDYGVKDALGLKARTTPISDALVMLALMVPSELPAGSGEKLDFLGAVPAMRQWVGPRSAKKPNEFKYQVTLKKFESTFDLPLDWVNNDKTTNVNNAIASLITRYKPQWYAQLIADLFNNGASDTCFDGAAFFSASHAWGDSGTYSNLLTFNGATNDAPTANEAASAICEAVSAMTGFKDDRGQPINEGLSKVVILVPAGGVMAASVRQAVSEKNLDTGTGVRSNPVLGLGLEIQVVASARITAQRMFVVNASPGAVPVAFVENTKEFKETMKGAGSDYEHDNDAWEFGLKAVGAAGYGRPTDATSTQFN